jgi:TonB-linked SusC/RagA family outer membrane protein
MKLTALIFLLGFMQVNASSFAQITIKEKNTSLINVFKEIRKQAGVDFFYNSELLNKALPVSIEVSNATLEETLLKSFKGQPFTYVINEKTVIVKENEPSLVQTSINTINFAMSKLFTDIDVRGKVVGDKGESLPGARITLKGGKRSVIANQNGEFVFDDVDEKATLIISYIGFKDKEVSVAKDLGIISLDVSVANLSDVVVTGIYNRKANSFTGAALTVSAEQISRAGNANVFQALRNISPSMVLDNFAQGSNPNAVPEIQLRGTSTFPTQDGDLQSNLRGNFQKRPNEPLFILDGFEASVERIYDLDLNRIESLTILKDAASKAIYGSRAANGVIVIETKKNTSDKTRVTYNANLDLEFADLSSYNLANSFEKLEAERIDGYYLSGNPDEQVRLNQLFNSRRKLALEGLNTYWLAKPLQDGIGQRHALTVELGRDALNMVADVSYKNVTGVMIGSDRRLVTGNLSASYRYKNLIFRNIISANQNNSQESPYGNFGDYARMNPYWNAQNNDGTIPYYAEVTPNIRITNPLYNSTLNTKNSTSYFNFTNNFYLEWTILPGLRAITRLGVDVKTTDADDFLPANHTRFENFFGDNLLRRGSYQKNNGKSNYLMGDFNVNYDKTIGKHLFFGNAGFNVREQKFSEVFHLVEGFASDRMEDITFGSGYAVGSRPGGFEQVVRDLGFLAAGSYMYDERYYTDLTFRTNASSQFGADKRWANFWSFGLGWNIEKENLFKNSKSLRQFRLRGSIGSTGNQNFNTNASVATYNYYPQSLYQGNPGSFIGNLANPGLQWESKFDYNGGLDVQLGKLSLNFDYYQSFTENLITDVTVPNSTGFNRVKDNLGKVKNSGIELYTRYQVLTNKNGFLTLNFGIETNRNKIVALSNAMRSFNERQDAIAADQSTSVPVKKYEDGMSMNAIWAVPSLGIDPASGNEIYVDREGNTTFAWNANDMVVAGQSNPDYQGTFGFTSEYKRVGLSVTLRYLGGGQFYNQTLVDRVENVDMNFNVDKRVLTGRWLSPGQNALFKRLGNYSRPSEEGNFVTSVAEVTRASTRFVQDRNDLSIGAVQLYYIFNEAFAKKIGMSFLKVAVNANEVAQFSSIRLERGTQYPFSRVFSGSLIATF